MAPSAGILGAVLLLVQSLAGPGAIERTSSWIDTDSDDTGLPPMPHAPPEDDPSRDARDDEDSDEAEQEVFDIPVLRHGDAPVLPEPQPAQGERPPRGRRQPEELANPKPTTRNYTPGEPSQHRFQSPIQGNLHYCDVPEDQHLTANYMIRKYLHVTQQAMHKKAAMTAPHQKSTCALNEMTDPITLISFVPAGNKIF